MKAGYVVMVIVGTLLALSSIGMLATGVAAATVAAGQGRDGFLTTPSGTLSVASFAITSPNLETGTGTGNGIVTGTQPGSGGRFAVESYLDFHGNKFTRRFDANSYIVLVEAMNSHDVSRGRGSLAEALSSIAATTLVVGIDSDRLFPVEGQRRIAAHLRNGLDGTEPVVLSSSYGHDGFLIENAAVGEQIGRLLR